VGAILTVASAKGGCGKSALSTVLAVHLALRGMKVAVVDSDPNQGFFEWYRETYEGPALSVSSEVRHLEIVDHVQVLAETHDVVLVDTAGFANQCASMAMGTADLVLIPSLPDRQSVLEAVKAARLVGAFSKASRREIPFQIVLCRWTPRGLVEKALLGDLTSQGLPIMRQTLSDLADFRKFTVSGIVPTTGKIAEQVGALIGELIAAGFIPPPVAAKAA